MCKTVTCKFSEKEGDFIFRYPELKSRNWRITASFFSHIIEYMIKHADRILSNSEETLGLKYNKPYDRESPRRLVEYLESGGFDIKTFKISISLKKGEEFEYR